MTATTGEYQGHPVITLEGEGKRPFSFGLTKAKLILEHIEDIKKFVEENQTEQELPTEE